MNSRSVSTRRILIIFFIIFTFFLQFLSTTQASAQQPLCGYLTWDTLGNYGYTILITCTTNERLYWYTTSAPGLAPGNYYSIEDAVIQDLQPPLDLSGGTVYRQVTGWSNYQIINSCSGCPSSQPTPTALIWRYPTDTLPPPPPPTSTPIPYPTLTPIPPPTSTPIPYPTLTPIPPPSSTYTQIPTSSRATSTLKSIPQPTLTKPKKSTPSTKDLEKPSSIEPDLRLNKPKFVAVGFNYPIEISSEKSALDKLLIYSGMITDRLFGLSDSRPEANYAIEKMKKFDFISPILHDKNSSDIIDNLKDASIFYFNGHGWQEGIASGIYFWNGEKYTTLSGGSNGPAKIGGMDANYVGDLDTHLLDLVVINGCSTGYYSKSDKNLLASFHNNGADIVIGFNTDINKISSSLWGKQFWTDLEDGKSVREASKHAATYIEKNYWYLDDHIKQQSVVILPKKGLDFIINDIPFQSK